MLQWYQALIKGGDFTLDPFNNGMESKGKGQGVTLLNSSLAKDDILPEMENRLKLIATLYPGRKTRWLAPKPEPTALAFSFQAAFIILQLQGWINLGPSLKESRGAATSILCEISKS